MGLGRKPKPLVRKISKVFKERGVSGRALDRLKYQFSLDVDEPGMNAGFFGVGLLSVFIGFIIWAMHPRQKGGFRFLPWTLMGGPIWFVFIALGIVLIAVSAGLPP